MPVQVEYELDGLLNFSRSITGTVFGSRHLRIIDIDGFKTDIPPSGSVLFFNNIDKPGTSHHSDAHTLLINRASIMLLLVLGYPPHSLLHPFITAPQVFSSPSRRC